MTKYRGFRVSIHGPSTLVYHPEEPLPGGAQVWMETTAEVYLEETY